MELDWDADKARANAAKHRVTFEEAATVFTRLLRRDPASHAAREGLEQALRARAPRKRG